MLTKIKKHSTNQYIRFISVPLQMRDTVGRSVAGMFHTGGKSGQHRASYFLTESYPQGWSNAEENNRLAPQGKRQG